MIESDMRYVYLALFIVANVIFVWSTSYGEERDMTDEISKVISVSNSAGHYTIKPCSSSPNCVSSMDERPARHIAPFKLKVGGAKAWKELKAIFDKMQRMTFIEEGTNYLHVEAKSRLFGFKDDVELYLIEEDGLIHVRSASRTGYWDLGANKRRIMRLGESLRSAGVIE